MRNVFISLLTLLIGIVAYLAYSRPRTALPTDADLRLGLSEVAPSGFALRPVLGKITAPSGAAGSN